MKFNYKTTRTMFVYVTTLVIMTGLLSIHIPGSHALLNHNSVNQDIKEKVFEKKEQIKDKIQEFRENILSACCPLCGC
ncbi:hypothetical protein [Candidatus Nitrosocosmicus sp. SS]|jgi:hypothetical protein|uniref:hypothetical protein n=1 Tax=Candidatus Nitrosocosmicus agrestis TaxID=2563600 RepID=UPI00122E687E|nr:hypothetical protein [Candidatus Nitrosocosmicus sp. SS]KAA2283119.1 hypothetical protein F1Z66_03305 [Candidatus Nitrosocosmicus sp. SS]KAF0868575.1 hypothetical protein E5N71_09335 [Candidatus Nitrosocosmicus sp. SS]